MKKTSITNKLTQKILSFLFNKRIFAWRNNTTGIFDPQKRIYRLSMKKGVADILGCLPPNGRFLAIEIKTGKDKLSHEQDGFLTSIGNAGGLSMVVSDSDDFINQWNLIYNSDHPL